MRSPENTLKKWENEKTIRKWKASVSICQCKRKHEKTRSNLSTHRLSSACASAGARGSKAALNKAAASLTKASVCAFCRTRSNVVEWQNMGTWTEYGNFRKWKWLVMVLFMPICRTYLQNAFHFPSPNHKSLTRFVPPRNVELCILGTSGRSSAPCHQQWWKQIWRNHIYWHVEFLLNFRIYWAETAAKNGKTPFTKNNLALRMFLSALLAPNASRNGAWPWQVQLRNWVTDISRHPGICRFGAWQKHKSSCIKFRVTWQFLSEKTWKKGVSDSKIGQRITKASASVPPPAALARLMRKAKTCAFKKGP